MDNDKVDQEITVENDGQVVRNSHWLLEMIAVLMGAFMAILDSSIVNVAITAMMNDFQATTSEIQWVITIYMLSLGVVVPASAYLSDYFGYKKLYIYSMALFTISSLFCALAWSETVLTSARVLQAVGGGMIMPVTMAMIYAIVPKEKIGSAMGMFGMTMLLAPAIGPTLGGYLVEYFNWRWIFIINLPIGMIGIFMAMTVLPVFPRKEPGKFDILGMLLAAGGLFCLLFALTEGQDWGWTSLPIVLLLYFSFALLSVFVYHELTTKEPLLNLRVFKHPVFSVGNLMLIIITVGMYGALFYIPLYLQSIRGLGAMEAGLMMLPPALVSGAMLPISGKIYDRYGPKMIIAVGILFLAYGTYLLHNIDLETPVSHIIWWNCVRSLGMGMTMMTIQTALMSSLPDDEINRGSAITNIVSRVAAAFGLAILTMLIQHQQDLHRAYLTWTMSVSNLKQYLVGASIDTSTATSLVQASIIKISLVNAITDSFVIIAMITLIAIIPAFFMKKGSHHASSTMVE